MTRPKDQFALNLTWGELVFILKIRGVKAFLRSLFYSGAAMTKGFEKEPSKAAGPAQPILILLTTSEWTPRWTRGLAWLSDSTGKARSRSAKLGT